MINISDYKNEHSFKISKNDYVPKKYLACYIMLFKGRLLGNAFQCFVKTFSSNQTYRDSFTRFAYETIQFDENRRIAGVINPDYQGISLCELNPFLDSLNNGLSIIKQTMSINDISAISEEESRLLLQTNLSDVKNAIGLNINHINCGINQDIFDFVVAKDFLLNLEYKNEKEIANLFYSLVICKDLLPIVIDNVPENNLEQCENALRELSLSINDPRFQIWSLKGLQNQDISELFFYLGKNINTLVNVINYFSVNRFDVIPNIVNHFIDNLERYTFDVLSRREHETLEAIGQTYKITRERVRQVEAKGIEDFNTFYLNNLVADDKNLLFVFPKTSSVFPLDTFSEAFGERNDCFMRLMKSIKLVGGAKYYKPLDAIVESEGVITNLGRITDEVFGEYFKKTDIENKIEECLDLLDDSGFDKKTILKHLNSKYRDCGQFYSRGERLTELRKLEILLEKHFDDGFHYSDNNQVKELNVFSMAEFGEEMYDLSELDKDNHIIQAVLIRSKFLRLYDRGTYIHSSKVNDLPIGLMGKIILYIANKNMPVEYEEIFKVFKDELVQLGINNRYALQGAMSPFKDELFKCDRDYLSPINNNQSLREAMVNWIDLQDNIFTYEVFTQQFKGAAKSVFMSALYDYKDAAYYWMRGYITLKALKLSDNDIIKLKNSLDNVISQYHSKYCSADEIFNFIKIQMPEFIIDKRIVYSYDLFSILQIVFRNDYKFKRPLVGNLDCEFETTAEIIDKYLESRSVVKLSELVKYLNTKCVAHEERTVLKIIEDKRDEFVTVDKDTMIRKAEFNITEREVVKLDVVIEMILEHQKRIDIEKDIVEKHYFNLIAGFKVNRWLVYGVVNSYLYDKYKSISETPIFKNGVFFIENK